MKIEVGKTYKSRAGQVVTIERFETHDTSYPFLSSDKCYMKNGRYFIDRETEHDLIEEVLTGENMNDYEKTIKDLQDRVKSLELLLQPKGCATKPKKWQPMGGAWWIDSEGIINEVPSTPATKNFGMERPTPEQAQRALTEMIRFHRLLALRDELCGDDVVDWSRDEAKYYLYCNEKNKTWDVNGNFVQNNSGIYFTTIKSAQRACDMLNSGEVEL